MHYLLINLAFTSIDNQCILVEHNLHWKKLHSPIKPLNFLKFNFYSWNYYIKENCWEVRILCSGNVTKKEWHYSHDALKLDLCSDILIQYPWEELTGFMWKSTATWFGIWILNFFFFFFLFFFFFFYFIFFFFFLMDE